MTAHPTEPEQPQIQCPACGLWEDDYDGFMVAHTQPEYENGCGWCSHPARDNGVCGICGDIESEFKSPSDGSPSQEEAP